VEVAEDLVIEACEGHPLRCQSALTKQPRVPCARIVRRINHQPASTFIRVKGGEELRARQMVALWQRITDDDHAIRLE
jgi:hypothetical protein